MPREPALVPGVAAGGEGHEREDFEYTNSGSLYAVYHEADLSALKQRQLWQNEFGAQAEIVEGGQLRRLEPS